MPPQDGRCYCATPRASGTNVPGNETVGGPLFLAQAVPSPPAPRLGPPAMTLLAKNPWASSDRAPRRHGQESLSRVAFGLNAQRISPFPAAPPGPGLPVAAPNRSRNLRSRVFCGPKRPRRFFRPRPADKGWREVGQILQIPAIRSWPPNSAIIPPPVKIVSAAKNKSFCQYTRANRRHPNKMGPRNIILCRKFTSGTRL